MTTKPAFPALGADVTGVGAWEHPCRGIGIAKILKKRQLHSAKAVIRWMSVLKVRMRSDVVARGRQCEENHAKPGNAG